MKKFIEIGRRHRKLEAGYSCLVNVVALVESKQVYTNGPQ